MGSGEVAHLFRRLGARTLKMLSVKRGRAGRRRWRSPISSALDLHTGGPPVWHGRVSGSCHTGGPSRTRLPCGELGAKAHSSARGEWCEPPTIDIVHIG